MATAPMPINYALVMCWAFRQTAMVSNPSSDHILFGFANVYFIFDFIRSNDVECDTNDDGMQAFIQLINRVKEEEVAVYMCECECKHSISTNKISIFYHYEKTLARQTCKFSFIWSSIGLFLSIASLVVCSMLYCCQKSHVHHNISGSPP